MIQKYDGGNQNGQIAIKKNNSIVSRTGGNDENIENLNTICKCNQGDIIKVECISSTVTVDMVLSSFYGYLLSAN